MSLVDSNLDQQKSVQCKLRHAIMNETVTHALIDIVLPLPGGPWNNNPRFHGTPRSS